MIIYNLFRYIEENISSDLDTALLSSVSYISRDKLYHDFYSISGHSVKEYVRKFAHGLTYPEDITEFIFDDFLQEKYDNATRKMQLALLETNITMQQEYLLSADTGEYWNKFASIFGKLYILKNLDRVREIYENGWQVFALEMFN